MGFIFGVPSMNQKPYLITQFNIPFAMNLQSTWPIYNEIIPQFSSHKLSSCMSSQGPHDSPASDNWSKYTDGLHALDQAGQEHD